MSEELRCPNPGCIHSIIIKNEFFCMLEKPRKVIDDRMWYCEDEARYEDFEPQNLYARYLPKE